MLQSQISRCGFWDQQEIQRRYLLITDVNHPEVLKPNTGSHSCPCTANLWPSWQCFQKYDETFYCFFVKSRVSVFFGSSSRPNPKSEAKKIPAGKTESVFRCLRCGKFHFRYLPTPSSCGSFLRGDWSHPKDPSPMHLQHDSSGFRGPERTYHFCGHCKSRSTPVGSLAKRPNFNVGSNISLSLVSEAVNSSFKMTLVTRSHQCVRQIKPVITSLMLLVKATILAQIKLENISVRLCSVPLKAFSSSYWSPRFSSKSVSVWTISNASVS